ncbi:MAG TPA: hypothetical protein VF662_06520 [Allosphingosinicella sp.]
MVVYLAEQERRELRASVACDEAAIAHATGFAWINRLEEAALLRRHASSENSKYALLRLTDEGRLRMGALLAELDGEWF